MNEEQVKALFKRWFYQAFDTDLLEKMEKHKLIAQAEGFSTTIMIDMELDIEEAFERLRFAEDGKYEDKPQGCLARCIECGSFECNGECMGE